MIEEDDDDGGTEEVKTFQEQEMEKQKLLSEQNRLANRGAAETVLLYISASGGLSDIDDYSYQSINGIL